MAFSLWLVRRGVGKEPSSAANAARVRPCERYYLRGTTPLRWDHATQRHERRQTVAAPPELTHDRARIGDPVQMQKRRGIRREQVSLPRMRGSRVDRRGRGRPRGAGLRMLSQGFERAAQTHL